MTGRATSPAHLLEKLHDALSREGISVNVMLEVEDRIARAVDPRRSPAASLERAGLIRSLHSHLQEAIGVHAPSWRSVRALHRAWIAANRWDDAVKGGAP